MAKQSKHIDPERRVRAFLASVEDYERLQRELPMGSSMETDGSYSTEGIGRRYWIAVLHMSVLRKFVAVSDHVAFVSVIEALRAIAGANAPREVVAHLDAVNEVAKVGWDHGAIQFVLNSRAPQGDGEFVNQQLYGWHLHGDVDKREALEGWGDTEALFALAAFTGHVVRVMEVTRDTARMVLRDFGSPRAASV